MVKPSSMSNRFGVSFTGCAPCGHGRTARHPPCARARRPHRETPKFLYILQSWDTAFKKGAQNSYSVCTTWGSTENGYYLLSVWRGRVEFPKLRRELVVQEAATDAEIESGFAAFAKAGVAGLIVENDPFFDSRRSHIVALSASNRLPGIFHIREYPADGGLMSYGASLSDTYRQLGVYAGKVLRGTKPDDLPVLRPTKFELVINTRTAKTPGLAVPQSMQIAADELIE